MSGFRKLRFKPFVVHTFEDCSCRLWMKTVKFISNFPSFTLNSFSSTQRSLGWVRFDRQRGRMEERRTQKKGGRKANVSANTLVPKAPGRLVKARKKLVSRI